MDTMNLPRIQVPEPPSIAPESSEATMALEEHYRAVVQHGEQGALIIAALESDSRVRALEGQEVCIGITSSRAFRVEWLAIWLLWAIREFGQDTSLQLLDNYLETDRIATIRALWVVGVEPEETISLDCGLRIVPLAEMPPSRQRDLFAAASLNARPRAAICSDFVVPKLMPKSGRPLRLGDQEKTQLALMQVVALLLNGVEGVGCLPYGGNSYLPSKTPNGFFGPSVGYQDTYDVLGSGTTKVGDESALLNSLLIGFLRAGANERSRMLRALSRLAQARRRSQIEDKVLDLGIALEMVLLDDNKSASQLALTFALRGSWLLASDPDERRRLYDNLRELYKLRSQVAHTGVLCGGDSDQIRRVEGRFASLSSLAGRIMVKLLIDGRPNWTDAILGAT